MNTLENDIIKIASKEKGAELTSIILKSDTTEYLWQADEKYWGRHAPILFPIVGKLKNDNYVYGGKVYNLSQHGFARDMEFELIEKTQTEITYKIENSNKTQEKYPFNFVLTVKYEIVNNSVIVEYNVQNNDIKDIYFSIGAHPAFKCPIENNESFEDYYLEFEPDKYSTYVLKDGLLTNRIKNINLNGNKLKMSKGLFRDDALIFKNIKFSKVSLKSVETDRKVNVEFKGFPYLGIWSKPSGAPFICIEPWYGLADNEDSNLDFTQKEGIIRLEPNKTFICSYKISIE